MKTKKRKQVSKEIKRMNGVYLKRREVGLERDPSILFVSF
jgi:hypothetical protein